MMMHRFALAVVVAVSCAGAAALLAGEIPSGDGLKQFEEERTDAYAARLEEYLRS